MLFEQRYYYYKSYSGYCGKKVHMCVVNMLQKAFFIL